MPAVSEKQRKFMGAELGRLRSGAKTDTGMTEPQLEDFATKPKAPKARPLPMRKGPPPKKRAPLSSRNPTPGPDRGTAGGKEDWEY
jgi:hypothetical protein